MIERPVDAERIKVWTNIFGGQTSLTLLATAIWEAV